VFRLPSLLPRLSSPESGGDKTLPLSLTAGNGVIVLWRDRLDTYAPAAQRPIYLHAVVCHFWARSCATLLTGCLFLFWFWISFMRCFLFFRIRIRLVLA
jgi:hypothetical protein